VKQQLADKLREDYGELSTYITSGERHEPEIPSIDSIELRYPEMSPVQVATIFPSLILAHEKQCKYDDANYAKMYGTICRVLSEELRDKVERAPS
jgi:hypothetical protein